LVVGSEQALPVPLNFQYNKIFRPALFSFYTSVGGQSEEGVAGTSHVKLPVLGVDGMRKYFGCPLNFLRFLSG